MVSSGDRCLFPNCMVVDIWVAFTFRRYLCPRCCETYCDEVDSSFFMMRETRILLAQERPFIEEECDLSHDVLQLSSVGHFE